jgi:hypothetical protein
LIAGVKKFDEVVLECGSTVAAASVNLADDDLRLREGRRPGRSESHKKKESRAREIEWASIHGTLLLKRVFRLADGALQLDKT